jgi:hypothetical protein
LIVRCKSFFFRIFVLMEDGIIFSRHTSSMKT